MVAHFASCQAAHIQDIEPGQVFAFAMRGANYYAVGMAPLAGDGLPCAAVVCPGHPEGEGRPGILFGNLLNGRPLLRISDVKVLLDLKSANFGEHPIEPTAGAMFLVENQIHLAVLDRFGIRTLNLLAGQYSDIDAPHRHAWFSRWQLAAPDVNGHWEPIANYSVPRQE